MNRKTKCFQEFALPFSYSKGMHNFLKVSDFRKCSSFLKYKFVMTTSTENMTMNASFLKKSAISKNHHKFYFSVHLMSYTNLMSHFSRTFINYFPNVITYLNNGSNQQNQSKFSKYSRISNALHTKSPQNVKFQSHFLIFTSAKPTKGAATSIWKMWKSTSLQEQGN